MACCAGNYHGHFVVVVDEDIDPANLGEVICAVSTRCDPKSVLTIVDACWSTPLDPAVLPVKKDAADFINSRAIINDCRPYSWIDWFPLVNVLTPEIRQRVS